MTTAWTNAAGGAWSTPGNWSMGAPGVADTARFTATALGQTTTMDLGASVTIFEYEIFQNTTNNSHTLNLGGNSLTMTNMRLAVDANTTPYYGHLNVNGSAGAALNITGTLNMATGRGSHSILNVAPNVAMTVGVNPATRGNLYVLEHTSISHANNTATLIAGNSFHAYLNNLTVSGEVSNGEYNANINAATLNLSNVTSGALDVAGSVLIGENFGARGIVNVSNHVPVKIGVDASNRGLLRIGSGGAKVQAVANVASSLTLGTGTFQAWLTELSVAHATATSVFAGASNTNFNANALLDLTNISGGFINVAGPVRVGTVVRGVHRINDGSLLTPAQPNNFSPRAIGVMKVGAIDVHASTLTVGDSENIVINNGVNGAIGRGTLELYGTNFHVSGAVEVDGYNAANSGLIKIQVAGESSGLLLESSSTLTIGNGSIDITFLAPDDDFRGEYFGLRWAGDHVADLLALGSKLTWNDAALTAEGFDPVSIYFFDGFTYVGTSIPPAPEPSSGILLACGALALARRRRKHPRQPAV